MNDLLDWQDDHHKALEGWRRFNHRLFTVVKKVEPKRETVPPDGVIYERARTRLTITEALRRITDVKVKTPEPGEVERELYPRGGK